ncbi:MAG: DUF2325 domain-containing protein [Thermodesulfobacteriota bacterium]
MCVALLGGMDRLEREYKTIAQKSGVKLKFFTGKENRIASRIKNVDLCIVFTNKISHQARNQVVRMAKQNNIPLEMHHSCGISTLADSLADKKINVQK